mgnify:CR=1 FL=1
MAQHPFSPDVERTAIALAYRPDGLIADRVLPRSRVGRRQFTYTEHDRQSLTLIPNTRIGRKSAAEQIEFGSREIEARAKSYGLSCVIPNDDEQNAPPNNRPSDNAVTALLDLIALDRERRVANLVFGAATYGTNTGTPNTKWSTAATSKPITDLMSARDACVKKPNKLVLGKSVWATLSTHPKVVEAVRGITENGVVSPEQIAQMLGISEVIVGESWADSAPKGKTSVRADLWGKHAAFLHVAADPTVKGGAPTFGLTAEYKGRRVLNRPVTIGLDDGVEYLVGEDVAELIIAPDLGYLLTDVIA